MQHLAHSKALNIERGPTLAFVSPRPMVLVVVTLFGISETKAVTMKDGQNRKSGKAQNSDVLDGLQSKQEKLSSTTGKLLLQQFLQRFTRCLKQSVSHQGRSSGPS
jgi:hypothetical protein